MLIKAGVDISRLTRDTRRALGACAALMQAAGMEIIVTSTYEGNHSPGSLHYANQAFDIRVPPEKPWEIAEKLVARLGKNYDVILEKDHFHVEYDPRGA